MVKYIKRYNNFWKVEHGVKTPVTMEEYLRGRDQLPLPEVREYDSIEEAIKGEDDLIAEED